MKVLITGSSGFIGRWVSNYLKNAGFSIIGIDKRLPDQPSDYIETILCNILDKNQLIEKVKKENPEVIIHLAARTDLDEKTNLSGYSDNIEGVKNLISAVKITSSVKRVIFTSSQLVCSIGYVPKDFFDYCPNTLYGESKVIGEKIVREEDGGKVEWCITRPTTVWGPYMSPHYQRMLHLIQKGYYFHCGNNELFKSYSFAGNIAFQYARLIQAPKEDIHGKTIYLADYKPLSLRNYANQLASEMNSPNIRTFPLGLVKALALIGDTLNFAGFKSFPFNSFRLKNILTSYIFDLSETEKICGKLPFSQEEGVKQTARWFMKTNKNR